MKAELQADHLHDAVAVTGIGMVTCQGIGRDISWRGVAQGHKAGTHWPCPLQGRPEPPVVAAAPALPRPADMKAFLWQSLPRVQQMACICVDEALQQAHLPRRLAEYRCGCFVSSSVCAMDLNEKFYAEYRNDRQHADLQNLKRVHPFELPKLLIRRHHITGPHYMNLTTCVGSAAAIGAAVDAIRCGLIPMAIVGGFDSLCRVLVSGFGSLKLIASADCRPFSPDRDGILPGEGGAAMVMESREHARQRGVAPLGYILGFGSSADAFHITKPAPDASGADRAIRIAVADSGIEPGQIDYIHSHGTGTRDNDAMELQLYGRLFPAAYPPITSTKHLTGHTFAACGAIETALCLLAMRDGRRPPGPGPNGAKALADTGAQAGRFNISLICNFAFGGNNTAIIAARSEESSHAV